MLFVLYAIIFTYIGLVSGSICLNSPFEHWSAWSACEVSCGGGFRLRYCYHDGTHETDRCNVICYNDADFYQGQCHCRRGTTAPCCEDILECSSNPCQNGGTCNEHVNYYTCTCPVGTTGDHCQDILDCASFPCKNGGVCIEHVNFYTCLCPPGTTGHDCDDILECASTPCLNNGTCLEHINYYRCQCVPGTTGVNCVDIPECASSPCQNGGTCVEMINQYHCTCPPTHTGPNCEKDLFSLHDSTCRTGSSCYVVFPVKDTWQGARDFCQARGGHLMVPNDLTEGIFMETFLESMRSRYSEALFWIGGTKTGSSPERWQTGRSSTSRWPDGNGPVALGTECVAMDGRYNFQWQIFPCDRPTFFICEEQTIYVIG
ncbi:fibropellin-1-like [Dreissena polymorpha]|uniref:Fibropellin-1-like n=1 Tax=Dreissena polymorpha TaxID=45954 RepID=A0A9D4S3V1_DREPO|nr:fibropellin-1-like [Dreissena polymorpha]XP_052247109.1 fibropellin-1-like [Dreissena polymorpha]XP_052247117.1 fibropellin-1-like [Dreissena polymorpha]KAH3891584.1 hypothetical protein DPMN_015688 [Dreissena polymorpha]